MTRYRCARGHFLPATFQPPPTDPDDWDDTCRCTLRPKRHRRTTPPPVWIRDIRRKGPDALQLRTIRTVPLVGSYL